MHTLSKLINKKCTKCKEIKTLYDFQKQTRSIDGLNHALKYLE